MMNRDALTMNQLEQVCGGDVSFHLDHFIGIIIIEFSTLGERYSLVGLDIPLAEKFVNVYRSIKSRSEKLFEKSIKDDFMSSGWLGEKID